MTEDEMKVAVGEVRAYALKNYNDDGWDIVVECWEDTDIADVVRREGSVRKALAYMRPILRTVSAHMRERESGGW